MLRQASRDVERSALAVVGVNESWIVERPCEPGSSMDEIHAEAEAGLAPSPKEASEKLAPEKL